MGLCVSSAVLLATPTNLIAIARTVAAVWRQEKLANQAREIAALGKELYARIGDGLAHSQIGAIWIKRPAPMNAFVGVSNRGAGSGEALRRDSTCETR